MKDLGYGDGYQYDPDSETGFSGANYFPDGMRRQTFYEPTTNGHERAINERLRHWAQLRDGGELDHSPCEPQDLSAETTKP